MFSHRKVFTSFGDKRVKNRISQQILVYLIICKKNEEIIIPSVRHGRDGLRGFSWGLVGSTAAADGRSFGGIWETLGRVMFWIVLTSEELFTHRLVHLRNSVTVAGRYLASFLIFLRKSYKNFPFNIPVFLKNLNKNWTLISSWLIYLIKHSKSVKTLFCREIFFQIFWFNGIKYAAY